MKVTAAFIGETLEKLFRQTKSKCARHILIFFLSRDLFELKIIQSTPDQERPAAEVDDATGQTFIHRHKSFACERITGIKTGAVTANTFFVPERFEKRLAKRDAAIFDCMMCIDFDISLAFQLKIDRRVF